MKEVKNSVLSGYYSAGVGAVNHAYQLTKSKKIKLAKIWAQKSEECWEQYFKKVDSSYHDAWLWYAFSLGIQGKLKEFENALKKSALLGKLDHLNDPALKKIRKMVSESTK